MSLPRRVLIAITSAHPQLHADGSNTGLWYAEALHPYQVFTDAGFDVVIASETGGYAIDPMSKAPEINSDEQMKIMHDGNHPFNKALREHVISAANAKPSDFGAFFAAGGHGASYDFPHAQSLQALAQDVYKRGGPIGAVCHGPVIFEGIKDSGGTPIIRGRTITGFPEQGEHEMKLFDKLRADNVALVEDVAQHAGARFEGPPSTFDEKLVIDGQIATGANPASAKGTAENVIRLFERE
ncbi:hypothetical protein KEM52_003489 [Ascosphaera acerosa]|nr:hypothetical protein KEM52_003489 [Ascosphaera acerosa]